MQWLLDATDTNTANILRGNAAAITEAFAAQNGASGTTVRPAVEAEMRLWFNPGRETDKYIGPGDIAVVLALFPPLLAALALSRETEQKTILQVYVSSISAHEYLMGKTLAFFMIALAEWVLVVALGMWMFDLRFAGDPMPFLVGTVVYLFCNVAFGVMAGAAIPNQAATIQAVATVCFVFSFLTSGFYVPDFKYSGWHSLGLKLSACAVFHRDNTRCIFARQFVEWRVARARGACAAGLIFSSRCMDRDAKDAGESMKKLINKIRGLRIWALFLKELRHIKRDRQLIAALIVPPTVQLIIFGFSLNPVVTGLRLGVLDESRTAISRDVISAFTESVSFQVAGYYTSPDELSRELKAGNLDAGIIIPSDFDRQRARQETAKVQLLLDAVNSNTAGIAAGYAERIIASVNQRLADPASQATAAGLTSRVALLYNPGLKSSWFMLTGVLGILLVLNGSLVAAGSMVKEKEVGTVEQLLMTPASAGQIITAKMAPLFLSAFG